MGYGGLTIAKYGEYYDECDDDEYESSEDSNRWLYISEDQGCEIIARDQGDGGWWVENGQWEGHIDENGDFICYVSQVNCGKPTIFESDEIVGDYYNMLICARKLVKKFSLQPEKAIDKFSIRNILQRETDSWLTGVLN